MSIFFVSWHDIYMSACSSGVRLPKTVESNLFAWVAVVWQYVKTPTWKQLRIKNSFHGAIKLCSIALSTSDTHNHTDTAHSTSQVTWVRASQQQEGWTNISL